MIAQSDPINISREQKINVVSTLVAYPLVLDELDLTNELLNSCNEINNLLKTQLKTTRDQLMIMDQALELKQQQIEILNQQLKVKNKNSWILPAALSLSGGLILGSLF